MKKELFYSDRVLFPRGDELMENLVFIAHAEMLNEVKKWLQDKKEMKLLVRFERHDFPDGRVRAGVRVYQKRVGWCDVLYYSIAVLAVVLYHYIQYWR